MIFSKIRVHVEFGCTMQTIIIFVKLSAQFDDIAFVQYIDAKVQTGRF